MTREAQHVLPQEGQWAVKAENAQKASKLFDSKRMAIGYAYDLAKNQEAFLVIHDEDGTVDRFEATEDTNKLIQMVVG